MSVIRDSKALKLYTLHKKWSFLLRISSVNMTKSAVSLDNFIFVHCYLCDGAGFNHLFEITLWWKDNLMVLKVEMTFISWLMENEAYLNFLISLDFFLPFKNHLLLDMLFFDCTNFGFSDSVDLFTYYACIVFSNKEF